MDLTVQIIVRNNRQTISKTLESVKAIASEILIADVGSGDGTTDLCRRCRVFKLDPREGYDQIRNTLVEKSQTEWQMCLHPWEMLAQGHDEVASTNMSQRVYVLQDSLLTREVRVWKKSDGLKFRNHVYEYVDDDNAELSPIYLFSTGRNDYHDCLGMIQRWKDLKAFDAEPFYYQALTQLAIGDYEGFNNSSEHYMFLDTKTSVSTVMNRYYYALVQAYRGGRVRPALQNLNLCIEAKPLMAEFWCLLGDIYYHLYSKYATAQDMYQNATVLGGRRLATDIWPMDVSKYDEYPGKMIESCKKLQGVKSLFIPSNHCV